MPTENGRIFTSHLIAGSGCERKAVDASGRRHKGGGGGGVGFAEETEHHRFTLFLEGFRLLGGCQRLKNERNTTSKRELRKMENNVT